jgi:hypothetical protein
VKKSLKASRSGGDVVEVLQRRLMTSSRRNVKKLIVWPDYDVLLPFFSQMIRNCKTLKISLPDLLLNFFTPSEGKSEDDVLLNLDRPKFRDNRIDFKGESGFLPIS